MFGYVGIIGLENTQKFTSKTPSFFLFWDVSTDLLGKVGLAQGPRSVNSEGERYISLHVPQESSKCRYIYVRPMDGMASTLKSDFLVAISKGIQAISLQHLENNGGLEIVDTQLENPETPQKQPSWQSKGTPPRPPPPKKNKALIRPYVLGGVALGGSP